LLADRYQVVQYPLILDTVPDEPPIPLAQVPASAEPYLLLSRFTVAVPRPFTQVMAPDGQTPLLLLEDIPLQQESPSSVAPQLLPTLLDCWSQAPALQQIAWLRQLAKFWQPALDQHVAVSVLDWQNIRVDGEDVRLLQLDMQQSVPQLTDLGALWQPLAAIAQPTVQDFLGQLTESLTLGQGTSEGLVDVLSEALEQLSQAQPLQVQVATRSDQGPARQRNEDACYPASGFAAQATVQASTVDQAAAPLVVVCDGIGGHEGGDIASQLAIAEVTQRLGTITATPNLSNRYIVGALKEAIRSANQAIANRNDADYREDRHRMGTTLVMALVYGARLYIAHLGDSRAYRIRTGTCRQITLDDDVAAREMRLGLGLYQDMLQSPGSGALVQALGVGASDHLRPTVTLYPITTDSLFLLCSDGLSDNDLVPQLWQSELRPALIGDCDVATTSQRLIELANTHNGHDNVTVALFRLQPQAVEAMPTLPTSMVDRLLTPPQSPTAPPLPVNSPPTAVAPSHATSPLPSAAQSPRMWPLVITGVLLAGLVGVWGAFGWQWLARRSPSLETPAANTSGEILSPSAAPPTGTAANPQGLTVGRYLQVRALPDPSAAATLLDIEAPPFPEPAAAIDVPERLLAVDSIVQVQSRQQTPDDQKWVRLQVCSLSPDQTEVPAIADESVAASSPTANSADSNRDRRLPIAQPGDDGWLLEADVPLYTTPLSSESSLPVDACRQ
jgi:serine/threonine protein phosphatase PrpC